MPQLIAILLVIGVALYLLGYVIVSIIISSIATIGSVIIIVVGSYFLRKSVINKMFSKRVDFLSGVNYSTHEIDEYKSKIDLYAVFAVVYSLLVMLEGQFFQLSSISQLKYNLGIYENLNNDAYNYDLLVFGGVVVCAIVIYSFTVFIKKKFTNWVISGIKKRSKKNPPTSPKPKKKPKTTTSRARKKPKNLVDRKKPKVTSKVNATQYGITSNTSKAETERILLAELVKWHNAENSSDLERREEARKHTRNLAILRGELL